VPATFHGSRWSLSWYFECRARIRWAHDMTLRIPVAVAARRSRTSVPSTRHAPPTVGSRRVHAMWRTVAETHSLRFEHQRLSGRRANCDLDVVREHRGGDGVFLLGTLGYAALNLDLIIEPSRGWRRLGSSGLQLGSRHWDRDHYITCRDPSQLDAIADDLRNALSQFRTVRMNDHHAVVELRNAGASKDRLMSFVRDLIALAECIDSARHHIPPPERMRECAPSWRELAGKLDGSLEMAHMAVSGSLAGLAVSVRTEWSPGGEPLHTLLEARPTMTIDEDHRIAVVAADEDSSVSAELGQLSPAATHAVDGARAVDITAEAITVTLPAPLSDTRSVVPRLHAMCTWARELSSPGGPYR
ncbi:MAG: hypothetical protein AAGC55_14675, partial [Myxococcota bacterium]